MPRAPFAVSPCRPCRRRLPALALAPCLAAALAPGLAPSFYAQGITPTAPPAGEPYHLRVSQTLLQVPTLVIDKKKQSIPSLDTAQFNISLGTGPHFHPSKLRLQGEDPISLTVLLDAGDPHLFPVLGDLTNALPTLYPTLLGPRDRISLYAADCSLVRTELGAVITPSLLRTGVHNALEAPDLHRAPGGLCAGRYKLWDDLAYLVKASSQAPGRRVLLLVSFGGDGGSHMNWPAVRHLANRYSVTIVALRAFPPESPVLVRRGESPVHLNSITEADPLTMLCGSTGGIDLFAGAVPLATQLRHLIELMRARYILEFPLPKNNQPGSYEIVVNVPIKGSRSLPAGLSYVGHDPTDANDPNIIPTDQSQAPELGPRRRIPSH